MKSLFNKINNYMSQEPTTESSETLAGIALLLPFVIGLVVLVVNLV